MSLVCDSHNLLFLKHTPNLFGELLIKSSNPTPTTTTCIHCLWPSPTSPPPDSFTLSLSHSHLVVLKRNFERSSLFSYTLCGSVALHVLSSSAVIFIEPWFHTLLNHPWIKCVKICAVAKPSVISGSFPITLTHILLM